MNTEPTSCCQCGVPFDLSLEAPISYIQKPFGKATCYDCMTCTGDCKTSLTKLKKDAIVWLWFDTPQEGVQCLPCIRKKQRAKTLDTELPALEPDPVKPKDTTTITTTNNGRSRWIGTVMMVGLIVGIGTAVLLKYR